MTVEPALGHFTISILLFSSILSKSSEPTISVFLFDSMKLVCLLAVEVVMLSVAAAVATSAANLVKFDLSTVSSFSFELAERS